MIDRWTRGLRYDNTVCTGVGDDAAVLRDGNERRLLVTTDTIVEGVHFTPRTSPALIGRKALAICLSDIAAMGGVPWAAVKFRPCSGLMKRSARAHSSRER